MYIIVKIFIAVGFNDVVCKSPKDGDYAETCRS